MSPKVTILDLESDLDDPNPLNYTTNPMQQQVNFQNVQSQSSLDMAANIQMAAVDSQNNMNLTMVPDDDFFDAKREKTSVLQMSKVKSVKDNMGYGYLTQRQPNYLDKQKLN